MNSSIGMLDQPAAGIGDEHALVVYGVHDDPVKALPVDHRRQVVAAQMIERREDRQRLEPELPRGQHKVKHRGAGGADARERRAAD